MRLTKILYRYHEVANILAISITSVRRLVQEGKLTRVFTRDSRRSARITAKSIEIYIAQIEQQNGSMLDPL